MCAAVSKVDGVLLADLNFASATLLIEHDPALDPTAEVMRTVEATGHGISRLDEAGVAAHAAPERRWIDRHVAAIATAGSGAFMLIGGVFTWFGIPAPANVSFAVAIVFGGMLVWRRALLSVRVRVLDMNVLMSVAVFGAAALGEWGEGAMVFFLFALGGLLESRALEQTRRSIRDLMELAPAVARVRRAGALIEVETAHVFVGETIVVRPGERVPLDGLVSLGVSALDESAITGESVPVDKSVGDAVFGGTLNTNGMLELTVTAIAGDSTLARIIHLVEEAQASKAASQRFVDRFSRVYTPVVLWLALAVALVPWLAATVGGVALGVPQAEWFRRALMLLVISCPCALVISTPVAIVSAITRAARDGVLVKGGAFLEIGARVRAVAFDKTGTLSQGRPTVGRVISLSDASVDDVLRLAAVLETNSNHPLARAVVEAAGDTAAGFASDAGEVPGRGVYGTVDGVRYEVCSPACADETGALDAAARDWVLALQDAGMTVLALVSGARGVGLIGLEDAIRPEAPSVLRKLREGGIEHLAMLTGDNERIAHAVAEQAGATEYRSRMLPHEKTEEVARLRGVFGKVAMVGDGVNDAPALAASDVGIAMGAAGSDTALETADVALMRDDLERLPGFFSLSRRTVAVIMQNVVFSIAVKAVFLALALAGHSTLWMAVFADTGVSLLVILNGMRLLRRAV